MNERKLPGELEMLITRTLQNLQKASVTQISAALDNQYVYTTILTVLSRLYYKKVLNREKIGRQYFYSLREKNHSILERIKQQLFNGKTSSMIHYLLETSEDISDKELEAIQKLLRKGSL